MEEVDALIFRDLKHIGCEIPDDVRSVGDIKPELLITFILKCLKLIAKDKELPRSISRNMAQKVNQATQLVTVIKEIGYDSGLSYHNLLYTNEGDIRKLLMWFQERLPRDDEVGAGADDSASLLNKSIVEEIGFLVGPTNVWAPKFASLATLRGQNFSNDITNVATQYLYTPASYVYDKENKKRSPAVTQYLDKHQRPYTSQLEDRKLVVPSVSEYNLQGYSLEAEWDNEWNTLGLDSGLDQRDYQKLKRDNILKKMAEILQSSYHAHMSTISDRDVFAGRSQSGKTQFTRDLEYRHGDSQPAGETEEDIQKRRQKERQETEDKLAKVEADIKDFELKIQTYISDIRQIQARIKAEGRRMLELREKHNELDITCKLLPNAADNITKLNQVADDSAKKVLSLATQWEQHRIPPIIQIREEKYKSTLGEDGTKEMLDAIKKMRVEMKEKIEQIHKKEERYKQLVEVLKKLPKENRSTYTLRILDMVRNVKKQKVEINKVLIDTKNLQKEINMVTETLNRSFTVTEEMIFKDAKKEPAANTAYKRLATINEKFNDLTQAVSETGTVRNTSLNLEDNIDKITKRANTLNMQKLEEDLKQVKGENEQLIAKIKGLMQQKKN